MEGSWLCQGLLNGWRWIVLVEGEGKGEEGFWKLKMQKLLCVIKS